MSSLEPLALVNATSTDTISVSITSDEIAYFYKLTNQNELSRFSVVAAVYSMLLHKYFDHAGHSLVVYLQLNGHELAFPLAISQPDVTQPFRSLLQLIARSLQQTLEQIKQGEILPLSADYKYAITFNSGKDIELLGRHLLAGLQVNDEGISLALTFNNTIIHPHIASQFATVFCQTLSGLAALPDQPLRDIPFISAEDVQLVSAAFNDTSVPYPDKETIVSLFEDRVRACPENVAITYADGTISYQELNQLANQFAHYLRTIYHITPDQLVGIKLQRSEWMVITIISILKAGGAYIPIDPEYPAARINYIQQHSGASIIIDDKVLSAFRAQQALYPLTDPQSDVQPGNLAYVIYTSGTTGNPKGVMITHRSLVNRLVWMQKVYALDMTDTILQKTTYSFDVSVWELLWWGLYGAAVAVPEPGAEKDPAALVRNIARHQVTVMHFVPSMLAVFMEYILAHPEEKPLLKSLRQVFASGEALTLHHRNTFLRELPDVSLINLYGPTEACIDVSYYDCAEEPAISTVPIGKPIDNIRLHILNDALQLLPVGVAGKLYISGVGVARGYLNNPELTREKFIPAPFNPHEVLYDTGDIARWLPDGNIEYLGRKDHQVKIRGYRIEFGEIENVSSGYQGIRQVVADTREVNGEKVLVLYYTADGTPDRNTLKSYLRQQLPEYMTPSYLVQVQQIPLTPNGKADRKALPGIQADNLVRNTYVPPANELEYELTAIWQDVLGITRVGITDNFFELGGHSLLIGQVINRLYQRLSRTITFRDFLQTPYIKDLSGKLRNSIYTPLPVYPSAESYPLSAAQQRLWILSQLDGGEKAYNIVAGVVIHGMLDTTLIEKAIQMLVARHEILRTRFPPAMADAEVRQQVIQPEDARITLDILTTTDIEAFTNTVFDLSTAPLIRAGIAPVAAGEHVLLLLMHHIISDGWSVELLLAEILETYSHLQKDINYQPVMPVHQYKDYVGWLQDSKEQERYHSDEQYWLQQFQGDIPQLALPAFRKRPVKQSFKGATIVHTFSTEQYVQLKRFSQQHQVSLFMTLMTAVNALLYRYSGQPDLIIGTPVAGRRHPDLEKGIGLFLNTLAIRTLINDEWTFTDLLKEQKRLLADAYTHQDYPFDELVSKLQLQPDRSRSVLFDVMVVLHNQFGLYLPGQETGLAISEYKVDTKTSHFDMTFSFMEKESLELAVTYNTDIYDERLIENIFPHLNSILDRITVDPDSLIARTGYISAAEEQQLLLGFNNTTVDFPEDKTWLHLFEVQVHLQPGKVAVKDSIKTYTYQQLDDLSDKIAAYLQRELGTGDQRPIGVMLDRSADMVVLLTAIQKTGRPYIPLDPSYPAERIEYVVKESGVKLLIVSNAHTENVSADMQVFALDTIVSNTTSADHVPLLYRVSPQDTAYIIYTSGSTGNPKGIEIGHRSLLNLLTSMMMSPGMKPEDLVFAVTSYAFDISVADFFTALIAGSTLYIAEQHLLSDPTALISTIATVDPTFIQATPSFYQLLRDSHWKGSARLKVLCGGDVFSDTLGSFLLDHCQEVWNMYGPTETTVYSCRKQISKPEDVASIGFPVNNTRIYILDRYYQPVPVGVKGNMYIAGDGLAKGYYGNPALTAQKFIPDPFDEGQMYETGDIAKWDFDGNIIFLGRNDHQVKVRGFRVELGEIESQLVRLPEIKDAVVLLNNEMLVAYVLTDQASISRETVIAALKQHLVHYMIPQVIVPLTVFPLTPSRKTDRNALLRLPLEAYISSEAQVLPTSAVEASFVSTWQEVLGRERIGVTDNFFEAGGNSIRAFRMINLINQQYGSNLKIMDVIDAPSIKELAQLVEKRLATSITLNKHIFAPGEKCSLSSNQRRLWILDATDTSSNAYNITNGILIGGNFDAQRFAAAYTTLCQRHESFRTTFAFDAAEQAPVQYVKDAVTPAIEWETLETMPDNNGLTAILNRENGYRFDTTLAPLSKLKIIRLPEGKYFVVIVMHHLISDAWSMDILIKEWIALYNEPVALSATTSYTYRDFVLWQQRYYASDTFLDTVVYWKNRLKKLAVSENLLLQQRKPARSDNAGGNTLSFQVPDTILTCLQQMAADNGVSLYPLLLTAFNVLLHHISGRARITLGTSVAGRPQRGLEHVVGFFINTIPVSLVIDPALPFKELLRNANRDINQDIQHQDISLDELLLQLNQDRQEKHEALFQGRFVFSEESFDAKMISRTTGISEIKRYYPDQADVKFDFSLHMKVAESHLSGVFEFRTAMYDRDFIELVIHAYCQLLQKITDDIRTPVNLLNTFSEEYTAFRKKKTAALQNQLFDSFSSFKKQKDEKHS
ncbi:amino acid adenylation domain-containing protein [Chitinophaga rhizophila]|uniref:Amino acid adenylation domain-containing protein n=1 Tax=Chitinophaga rhizophila TaxID=2866212 RepID=A0ABS7G5Z0_9BACT|nr:non-ribosomal peptide synthetase [Chitinophaga rhizophila]MBW8683034.1 amino acid adenylation domain-containing protein [Chitinophaga rhizophila]